jgi:hypothetical protein
MNMSIALMTTRALRGRDNTHVKHNDAQRAPAARPGFVDISRECAQTSWTLVAKRARFSARSVEGDGSKNRRLRQCKILSGEVLISVTLSLRGEVAERPKAAVC